jgi:hypothetical protein
MRGSIIKATDTVYSIDQKESQPILLRNELVDSLNGAGSLDDIDVEAKFFNISSKMFA